MNSNCSNLLDMTNLQEQVKKAFCYQLDLDQGLLYLDGRNSKKYLHRNRANF